jgi:hypothetical protein
MAGCERQYCGGAAVDAPELGCGVLRPARIVEPAARKRDRDNVWNWRWVQPIAATHSANFSAGV